MGLRVRVRVGQDNDLVTAIVHFGIADRNIGLREICRT